MDVHRKFADAPITFPVAVWSSAGPADDFAIDLRNNDGITTGDGLKPRLLIFRRSRLGFIGGDAVLDALIVNFSNRRWRSESVCRPRLDVRARHYAGSVEIVASPEPCSNACCTARHASIAHFTRCGNFRTPCITRRSPNVFGASLVSAVTRS